MLWKGVVAAARTGMESYNVRNYYVITGVIASPTPNQKRFTSQNMAKASFTRDHARCRRHRSKVVWPILPPPPPPPPSYGDSVCVEHMASI